MNFFDVVEGGVRRFYSVALCHQQLLFGIINKYKPILVINYY